MNKFNTAYLIDDDKIYTSAAGYLFNHTDFCNHLHVFENGKSALENLLSSQKLDKAKPDIIFLDINMPIMDGWQFIEQLKKHNLFNDLLIYIVSSSSDPNDLKLAEMNNLKTRILQKPLSSEKLKNIINLHKSKLNKSN